MRKMMSNVLNAAFRRPLSVCAVGVFGLAMATAVFADAKREFPEEAYFMPADDASQKPLEALVGKAMPPLQVSTDWINGAVTPADMKGKIVVIDIFATWCGPCIASIPHNNALYAKHKGDGLVFVGVCTSDSGQEKLPALASEKKIAYPVARDPDLKTADAYHVQMFPTYVVVDRKGIVRAAGLTPQGMEEAVEKLLAEK